LSDAASPTTPPAGQNPACTASKARSNAAPTCYSSLSPFPSSGLVISTLTWWALYNTVVGATILLRSLSAHPNGWKQSPFLKHPQQRVHVHVV
jgi:hypothetical protein